MSDFGPVDPASVATQMIRDYCGWHVAPLLEDEVTIDGTGADVVLLPSRRVHKVTSVTVHGEELSDDEYEWSAIGALRRKGGRWPDAYRSIKVTFEHGLQDMAVLAGVVDSITARVRMDPTGMVTSQRAGTQSVSFGGRQSSGGHGLLASEKESLAPYKLNWGP